MRVFQGAALAAFFLMGGGASAQDDLKAENERLKVEIAQLTMRLEEQKNLASDLADQLKRSEESTSCAKSLDADLTDRNQLQKMIQRAVEDACKR
jgi:septal ring factor EnvC (AmiA/AmiB activator)